MTIRKILFKRGDSPIPQALLDPGEPGWRLDTGKLYIGIETGDGRDNKLINVLDEDAVEELFTRIESIAESISSITEGIDGVSRRIDALHPPPTYSYTRYAKDDQGTGFSKTFNPAIHTHKGIYVSSEQLTDSQITADLFIGLWEPYAPLYTYTRYASDDQGTDFSSSYVVGTHTHRAVLTHTYLSPSEIVVELFEGLWTPWAPDDTYDGGTW